MSEIRWKLAEYLKFRGITADKLVANLGNKSLAETVYRIVENPSEQRQIDLSALAAIIESLVLLIDYPVDVGEILEFRPHLPEEFVEKSRWRDIYLNEDSDDDEWGDVDPTKIGKPVRYIPGVGLVIAEKEGVKQLSD